MDTPIKGDRKDDRNTQEIPVKPDSKINIELEEAERRYTQHIKPPIMEIPVNVAIFSISVTENITTGVITGDTAGGSLTKQP